MKNKFLSKLVVVALIVCTMFAVTACSWQKDVNIKSITVKESTLPQKIEAGQFDEAGIVLLVTYEDNSTSEIAVTSELIPEKYQDCLTTPGIYEIEIVFKGFSTKITVTIVSDNIYVVDFYNALGRIISRQYIESGESAQEPAEELYTVEGYEFVGWDRTFSSITEDTNVYGVYVNVKNLLSEGFIYDKIESAREYMRTTDFVATEYTETSTMQNIYHYDEENDLSLSQCMHKNTGTYSSYHVVNCTAEGVEQYSQSNDEDPEYSLETYEEYQTGNEEIITDEEMLNNKLCAYFSIFNEDGVEISFDVLLTENINLYSVEAVLSQGGDLVTIYRFIFDDEKLLTYSVYGDTNYTTCYATVNYEYVFVEFDDTLIPEEYRQTAN